MKKFFVVLSLVTFLLIGSSALGIELVTEEGTGTLTVSSRAMTVQFDTENGVLLDITNTSMRKVVDIYNYSGDGYDILDEEGNVLLPISHSSKIDVDNNFVIDFEYENNSTKTFVVKNDPFFTIDVILDFNVPVSASIPFVNNSEVTNDYSASYLKISGQKTFMMSTTSDGRFEPAQAGFFKTAKFVTDSGKGTISSYSGPVKLLYISKGIPDYYDTAKSILGDEGALNWFSYVHHGLVVFLYWLFEFFKSFGWAIIVFTIVIRFILYPLYHMQTKSMVEMRKLAPEMAKIKKKYKDPRKQQEATATLYKEHGVNPAGGCLPLLIQLPVLWVLYSVIQYFSEWYAYSPKFLIWTDLSTGGFLQNSPLLLISVVVGVLTAPITSQDGRTARQGILMSSIFPILFYSLPTGLFVYWTANSVLQYVITLFTYRRLGVKGISFREILSLPPKPAK